ncbi:hypothetical protein ACFYV7_39400 [Nocardia suismassiliense]|uniref:ESX-1 secretion-associated protein EspA/EspE-like domain-containing protein n=1 Tax=Nocardia suismassiliense TaxID=2077092 RepID=A0ABW6R5Z8_9NOCA
MSFPELMKLATDIRIKAQNRTALEAAAVGMRVDPAKLNFSFIEAAFAPFSQMPDPARYDPLIADLNVAMAELRTDPVPQSGLTAGVVLTDKTLNKMTTAGGYLNSWTGVAAMEFKRNFIDNFKTIADNQFNMLSTMKGALQAHQAMWRSAHEDIKKIAEDTRNALDNMSSCNKNQWTFFFSVMAAVGTISAAGITIITGGATAPVVAIGATASLGSAGVSGKTARSDASGATVDAILREMHSAINKLTTHIQTVETEQIADKVRVLTALAHNQKHNLISARPQLVGMSDSDLLGKSGMGRPH